MAYHLERCFHTQQLQQPRNSMVASFPQQPRNVKCKAWSELYAAAASGAVFFTAAPKALQLKVLDAKPTATDTSNVPAAPSDQSLWTVATVLSALPFCGWMVWPGLGLLRQRQGLPVEQQQQYWWFAALYGLPLLRSMLFGLDELALVSVFFCVLHVQVERWARPQLLVPKTTPDTSTTDTAGTSQPTSAATVSTSTFSSNSDDSLNEDDGPYLQGDVLESWDRRWTLRSMPVSQLLAISREKGIRGRSKMSKRELLEALESIGVHDELQNVPMPLKERPNKDGRRLQDNVAGE